MPTVRKPAHLTEAVAARIIYPHAMMTRDSIMAELLGIEECSKMTD